MIANDGDLLGQYALHGSEEAFAALVQRHLDLVYSAALRQVRSPQLAEEVAQSVFTDLARNAHQLKPDTILGAWLYQVTRRTAVDLVRREVRRQLREQIATEMTALHAHSPADDADWSHIEPLLDEAMDALEETDRAAVLLRYFENKSFREVGAALGTSDDAAQKRVSRAVERLRDFLARRGVAVGAGGLAAGITAHAVQAAPAGLAAAIAATGAGAVAVTGIAVATLSSAAVVQTIAMTTLQKVLVTAALIAAAGVAIYEATRVTTLHRENETLRQEQAALTRQVGQLQREHEGDAKRLANLTDELAAVKRQPTEVHQLRGQVGVLRQEKDALGSKSALSKITADPATRKMIRDQQKLGMGMIYGDLAKRLKLTSELKGQFDDLLADHVMENIDVITQALHDQRSAAEVDRLFSAQEAVLNDRLAALLGPEGLAQYQEYSKDIAATLTAEQFVAGLTGDAESKSGKKAQLSRAMQEEIQSALTAAGLPGDFQTVPTLNFRNIASEEFGERSLKLLDGVFEHVAGRTGAFLSAEEQKKFLEFWKTAIANNRTGLLMNRNMMAPIGGP